MFKFNYVSVGSVRNALPHPRVIISTEGKGFEPLLQFPVSQFSKLVQHTVSTDLPISAPGGIRTPNDGSEDRSYIHFTTEA